MIRAYTIQSYRLDAVMKAAQMIASGVHSLRTAAIVLGVSATQLCIWRKLYQQGGRAALLPKFYRQPS
jgi:transposase-like protein